MSLEKSKPFTRIFNSTLDDETFVKLSKSAKIVFLALCRCYNGRNNGKIEASYRHIAKLTNIGSHQTISKALRALEKAGLIEAGKKGKMAYIEEVGVGTMWRIKMYGKAV
jgi:DNA-binding transcriptional ArsR family regulator